MERLVYDMNPFSNCWRITATSETYFVLQRSLASAGTAGLTAALTARDCPVRFVTSGSSHIEFVKPHLVLHLSEEDSSTLKDVLRELAESPHTLETSLSELNIISRSFVGLDLEFRKQDQDVIITPDYNIESPHGFGTWEAVLFHEPPNLQQFEALQSSLRKWARSSKRIPAESWTSESPMTMADAHSKLFDPDDETLQIDLYFKHPLTVRYGSIDTDGQLWLDKISSEFILPPDTMFSGNYQIDVRNFYSYLQAVREFALVLGAKTFLWGDTADSLPDDQQQPVSNLSSEKALWEIFQMNYADLSPRPLIPESTRSLFQELFVETTGSGTNPSIR